MNQCQYAYMMEHTDYSICSALNITLNLLAAFVFALYLLVLLMLLTMMVYLPCNKQFTYSITSYFNDPVKIIVKEYSQ